MSEKGNLQVYDRIQASRASFTPAQARIADYLLGHSLDAALLTATELAQRLDVDPATVVRFAQKLGFRGYLELKTDLGRLVRGEDRGSSSPQMSSLGQALEIAQTSLSTQFDHVWESLEGADLIQLAEALGTPCRLLLLADESCAHLAAWLADELRSTGFSIDDPARDPDALAASMLTLSRYDRALILEGSLPSPTLGHLMQELQGRQIRSLALLGSASSPIINQADVALILPTLNDSTMHTALMQQLLTTILHAVQLLRSMNFTSNTRVSDPQDDALGNSDES